MTGDLGLIGVGLVGTALRAQLEKTEAVGFGAADSSAVIKAFAKKQTR